MSDDDASQMKIPDRNREFTDSDMEQVRQSLQGLMFGSVSIVVQDGVIVQIDRTEKRRLRGSGPRSPRVTNR